MEIHCKYDALVPPEELIPNPLNANDHSDEQIERLCLLFDTYGIRHPIICDLETRVMAVGHGRLLAAKKKKMDAYPVVYQKFKSKDEFDQFAIADNAIALWAELNLKLINERLPAWGPELNIKALAIKDFVLEPANKYGDKDADATPETRETSIRLGDLFQLGAHRLLCGDSTSAAAVERLMNGEKADMVFTSPPYNLGASSKLSGNTQIAKRGNAYEAYDDAADESDWLSMVSSSTLLCLEHSRYAFVNIQFLAGNRTALPSYWASLKDKVVDVMVWDKGRAQPAAGERVLNSRFEFIFIFTSDENPCRAIRIAPNFRGTIDNVYSGSPQRKNEFSDIHGATFPVELPETFIKNFCPINGSIIDPFLGSGSTLIACEKTNRKCYGMEIDPIYIDVIIRRWEKFTGQKAVKL